MERDDDSAAAACSRWKRPPRGGFGLASIAACVIGGVSLFGGIGRAGNVILGAIFITLLTNGMNLVRIDGYLQQVVLGAVLIFAIIVDQTRLKYAGQLRVQ